MQIVSLVKRAHLILLSRGAVKPEWTVRLVGGRGAGGGRWPSIRSYATLGSKPPSSAISPKNRSIFNKQIVSSIH